MDLLPPKKPAKLTTKAVPKKSNSQANKPNVSANDLSTLLVNPTPMLPLTIASAEPLSDPFTSPYNLHYVHLIINI